MYRLLSILILLGSIFCFSCSRMSEQERKMEAELRQFKENTIVFPDNMIAKICEGKTPLDTTLLNRSSKLVVYVGPDGCTDCKLRSLMPLYMFILENRHKENFGVVVIIHSDDIETAEFVLSDLRFRHTVFYDVDGSFVRLNPQLPVDERYHTFLLDKRNRVVLIGNPTHNEKLKDLYLAEIDKNNR